MKQHSHYKRCSGTTHPDKMPPWAPWRALSVVLIVVWARPPAALACPHPCSCYVPTEVHCTFRSLASVPAGISTHVERINLGFNSIQALSETSFAGLTKLELLMVHGNNIPSIPDGALKDLSSLQVLKFSYNKLRVLTAQTLQGLWSLARLHVDHNQIEFVHPQAFRGLTSLRLLQLEGNRLRQLHPATFATLTFLDYFRLSNIRHLYLAENELRTLPEGLLANMPLLENLYLQGNPWTCDCHMRWLLAWQARAKGVLKCKKDKALEGGQLCATCSGPRKLLQQEVHKLQDLACRKPSIESPLRHNNSSSGTGEEEDSDEDEDKEDGDGRLSLAGFHLPPWNVTLNMTDEHGNTVGLFCHIRKPTDVHRVQLNQTEGQELDVRATVALDWDCPMTRDSYEKLWKLIAYYSEVPVRLQREAPLGGDPALGYHYRQDADDADALYYTGVRARVHARPEWVMQPSVRLQLDRRRSTATEVLLSYHAPVSFTTSGEEVARTRPGSWVMIEPSGADARTGRAVLEGAPCQLSCNVRASESPSILWVLPDGSVLRAPAESPDGALSLLTSGRLTIRTARPSDSGLYQCIAQVRDDVDRVVYRVLVQPAAAPPPDRPTVTVHKSPGEAVMLPCRALAVPEAQLSWVLPNNRLVSEQANTSQEFVLPGGALSIPKVQAGHSGYYTCLAVNQQGVDRLTVGVSVSKKGSGARSSKRGRRPAGKVPSRVRGDVVEDEGGSGLGQTDDDVDPSRRGPRPKAQEEAGSKKGRRKQKPWRGAEQEPQATVAEGRRPFESRRRAHMASKQIRPEHWADILARVRGKNPPRGPGTGVPEAVRTAATTTTAPAVAAGARGTPVLPAASPPSLWPARAQALTTDAEEFSAEAPLPGEEDPVSSPGPRPERDPDGDGGGTRGDGEDVTDDHAFSETTERPARGPGAAPSDAWTPLTLDARDSTATESRPRAGQGTGPPAPPPAPRRDASPREAVTLAFTDPVPSVDPEEPFGGLPAGESPVPPPGGRREGTQGPRLGTQAVGTQSTPLIRTGAEKNSLRRQEGRTSERRPAKSRRPEGPREGTELTTPLDSTRVTAPSLSPGEAAPSSALDPDSAPAVAMTPTPTPSWVPATHPPRRRPHGRRRLRPHRFRQQQQRQKHGPPTTTTAAPTETLPTWTTRGPGAKTPEPTGRAAVPTSWAEVTAGLPKQVDAETLAELVTKGTPRRKPGRRPHKHRSGTPTATPTAAASSLRPVSDHRHRNVLPPSPEASLTTADTRAVTTMAGYGPGAANTRVSAETSQGPVPATEEPVSNAEERARDTDPDIHDRKTDQSVPGEPVTYVVSSPGSVVPAGGELKEGSPGLGVTRSWTAPWGAQTDAPVTSWPGTVTDTPSSPSTRPPPPVAIATRFQQEDVVVTTGPWSPSSEPQSPTLAETATSRVRGDPGTPPPAPRPELRPQDGVSTPAPTEGSAPAVPPTTTVSLARATPRPTYVATGVWPTSTAPRESISFNDVAVPETKTPPVMYEGTRSTWRKHELSTPAPTPRAWTLTPRREPEQERVDDKTRNSLPRGSEGQTRDGTVLPVHQPARVTAPPLPPRGTIRPVHTTTTQSSRRYLASSVHPTVQLTNKPGITAYPWRVWPETGHRASPRLSTAAPRLDLWPSSTPKRSGDPGADRLHGHSKVLGSNNLPDLRDPGGQRPSPGLPRYPSGRLPFFLNRTWSFPQLGTPPPKPPAPTTPAPVPRERNVRPGPYHRIHSQSVLHGDLGPPAPPLWPRPRTASPPATRMQHLPAVPPTRSPVPSLTSPGLPFGTYAPGGSRLSPAVGPPASKFWSIGEKPLIVTKSPQTVTVTAETDAVLPCEATGEPKPFVTWTKVSTGALLTPNSRAQRFEVLKNGTFVIRQVQVQDRGQYLCTAKNAHGVDRRLVVLSVTVQQPQILASHYKDVTVYLGDTVAMECLAKGTPAPQISWIFPDRRVWQTVSPAEGRVTLHENRTLSIKEASFADRGVYKCVASNAAGADSLAIRLHVAALPPVIQQEKAENISLPPGLSVHIHCTAKAAPPPSVRWQVWDGTQVRPSQFLRGNLFVFPNGTLYIRNLAAQDSGRYECVAANLVGSARRTVQLTVRRAAANARITGTSPQRTNVHYGGTLRLDCSASGDPWPRILWRLPSKRMIDSLFSSVDTRVKAFANGTLVVKSVTDKDAGDYLCVARNKVGDDFVVLKVNVVMKPAKIDHKGGNDHQVFYGRDLKVDCVASGLPNPEISWGLPDGSLVTSFMQADDDGGGGGGSGGRTKRYVVFDNGTLYFNEVGPREEGDYTCFAENQVGKDAMTVRVKVLTEPAAAVRNQTYSELHVPYGDVVTVACEAKGQPAPRVTWLSPTNRLIPASSDKYHIYGDGTLLIQKAQRSDSGNYTCVVRNGAGEDRKTVWVHVTVQSPRINGHPNAITTVREVAAGGTRKLIDCRAEGVPAPTVLWSFPEGVVLPAPYYGNRVTIHRNGTLDIKSLRRSDSVQLACIGRNEGGEARLLVQLTVLEPAEKPVFHDPVNEKITAAAGHTISLNCSAAGAPAPRLLWILPNGTELRSGQRLQRFFHRDDGRLHISGLSPADAGAYRCVARNSAGHTERLVSLKVGLKPAAAQQYHNLVNIVNGETLQLPCPPSGGRPARLSWTLPNGMVLQGPQTRGRFSLGENGTLTVREASVFDRGTYVCRADTEHGPAVVTFPVIVIAYPPRITSEPTPVIYTRPGNTVKMNCMAVGVPKAQISWELPDGSQLTAGAQARLYGNRFLHPQGSLTVQQVTRLDAGFYRCTAKNVLGSDSQTTYIHVY
ncbi:matrix-remodeling-associated protein 5 isoform X3 [Saccopteryx leptura]|uniref:matrix-remodeling-associated protein 5 isoform X3 n=1 Tax=Saccopteryx leptura TaxID=249018 RepID=UPI00339BD084